MTAEGAIVALRRCVTWWGGSVYVSHAESRADAAICSLPRSLQHRWVRDAAAPRTASAFHIDTLFSAEHKTRPKAFDNCWSCLKSLGLLIFAADVELWVFDHGSSLSQRRASCWQRAMLAGTTLALFASLRISLVFLHFRTLKCVMYWFPHWWPVWGLYKRLCEVEAPEAAASCVGAHPFI